MEFIALRIVYFLNILVAGQIAISAIRNPSHAAATTFGGAYEASEVMRLVGCLWGAIALLSVLGVWKPMTFAPVLLLQLIYKGAWLFFVARPAFQNNEPYPKTMAIFFVVWVVVLPFLIPWKAWINSVN